jgi:general secretion pathway protein C
MRLELDPRARRLLRRVPRTTVYTALELALLSLLALQCARLAWTIATPVGPVGEWKALGAERPVPGAAIFESFDPFFRLSGQSGPVVVTSLNLKLYGVRQDQASGRGSAIISTPDGQQRSFGVGEEIVPGVTLKAVEFDSATIERGGVAEQLFMDQSPEAEVIGPAGPPQLQTPPPMAPAMPQPMGAPPAAAPRNLAADVRFQPRLNGSQVTGVAVQPQGSGDGFRSLGLAPGDVITAVNGRRIGSPDQARSIAEQIAQAGPVTIQVERAGRVVTLRPETRR